MVGRGICYTQGLILYIALLFGRQTLMAARITWTLSDLEANLSFSIKHLLLTFPVWAIAFLVQPFSPRVQMRVTYHHTLTTNYVRCLLLNVLSATREYPTSLNQIRSSSDWPDIRQAKDSWGRQLQLIESERTSVDGFRTGVHVYSLGADGFSETQGNDPDDINSWDDHHLRFYAGQIRNEEVWSRLFQSLWQAPLLYLITLATIWFFRNVK